MLPPAPGALGRPPATGAVSPPATEKRVEGHPPVAGFELVVANLPYVRDDEWGGLAPEIRNYEPCEALLGGPDGLVPIRSLPKAVPGVAASAIALEIGAGQADDVAKLVEAVGFGRGEVRNDLAGIERVVVGRR